MQQQHELNGDIEQFLQQLNRQESAEHEAETPRAESRQPHIDKEPIETIHVYFVKEDEADQSVIESTINEACPTLNETDTQPLVTQSYSIPVRLVPYLIMAAHLLIVLAAFSINFYILLTETATITIMPKHAEVRAHLTFSNLESRLFQPLTLTQSRRVPATGQGHQDAAQATGTISLYNASIQEQTIDAGTLIIGADGQHIVTDQTAVIPGASPPSEGQATVNAHAVNPGPAGNIHPGDIRGACCRENIFAYNSAFQGGADERDYTIVMPEDITSVVFALLPTLTQQINTAFQEQVHPGELLTPTKCSQKVSTDRQVGDEATQVTITVTRSCLAGAYSRSDFHRQVQQALLRQAVSVLGGGYSVSAYFQTAPIQTSIQRGTLTIGGTFEGRMIYEFSAHELTTLRQQLAGKTKQQGVALLSHLNGIDQVTAQLGENGSFPTDPTHIHILFLVVS